MERSELTEVRLDYRFNKDKRVTFGGRKLFVPRLRINLGEFKLPMEFKFNSLNPVILSLKSVFRVLSRFESERFPIYSTSFTVLLVLSSVTRERRRHRGLIITLR